MVKRKHLFILLGFYVVMLVLGSFFDYQLSSKIFVPRQTFGIIVSAFGLMPTYLCFAFGGGYLIRLSIQDDFKKVGKVLLIVLGVLAIIAGTFYAQKEITSVNGFNLPDAKWVGYVVTIPLMLLAAFFGYKIGRNNEYKYTYVIIILFLLTNLVTLLGGVTVLKDIFHRPRFRSVIGSNGAIPYHNWYEPFKNYASYITDVFTKEEFKSFPSGHSGTSAIMMIALTSLPFINKKFKGQETKLLYIGFAWNLFVAFTRILVGAHFLSDVAMGAIIVMIIFIILNEFVLKKLPKVK